MHPPGAEWAFGVLLALALGQALGLRERRFPLLVDTEPGPRRLQPVPRVLARIAREREAAGLVRGPCFVPELGVPGDALRALPDRGSLLPSDSCLQRLLYFNLSAAIRGTEQPTAAELGLDLGSSSYDELGPALELAVSVVPEPRGPTGPTRAHGRLVAAQSVRWPHGALRVRLQGALRGAARRGRAGLALLLELRVGAHGSSGPLGHARDVCARLRRTLRTALLVATLDPSRCRRPARPRRAVAPGPEVPKAACGELVCGDLCRRRRLFVSFRDLGWDKWVIAPRGFMANYCLGACPLWAAVHRNSSNHALLLGLLRAADPALPPAACVPTRLSPISMLYHDHDSVVLRHYEDMVVDECGCG